MFRQTRKLLTGNQKYYLELENITFDLNMFVFILSKHLIVTEDFYFNGKLYFLL